MGLARPSLGFPPRGRFATADRQRYRVVTWQRAAPSPHHEQTRIHRHTPSTPLTGPAPSEFPGA